jgi:hypothetical protein
LDSKWLTPLIYKAQYPAEHKYDSNISMLLLHSSVGGFTINTTVLQWCGYGKPLHCIYKSSLTSTESIKSNPKEPGLKITHSVL